MVGLLQGVTELFPVSSLAHSVLIPALIGGRWAQDLNLTADKSPYLTFLVAVHVATAVALVCHASSAGLSSGNARGHWFGPCSRETPRRQSRPRH